MRTSKKPKRILVDKRMIKGLFGCYGLHVEIGPKINCAACFNRSKLVLLMDLIFIKIYLSLDCLCFIAGCLVVIMDKY